MLQFQQYQIWHRAGGQLAFRRPGSMLNFNLCSDKPVLALYLGWIPIPIINTQQYQLLHAIISELGERINQRVIYVYVNFSCPLSISKHLDHLLRSEANLWRFFPVSSTAYSFGILPKESWSSQQNLVLSRRNDRIASVMEPLRAHCDAKESFRLYLLRLGRCCTPSWPSKPRYQDVTNQIICAEKPTSVIYGKNV